MYITDSEKNIQKFLDLKPCETLRPELRIRYIDDDSKISVLDVKRHENAAYFLIKFDNQKFWAII